MVYLEPSSHLLASYINSNIKWWKALAELVDNSLDAGAKRVVIDITDRELTVSDDGAGCEDITALFRLGDHNQGKSSKQRLGRYGIGAKDAWLGCADTMTVVTRRGQVESTMSVNCYEWEKNKWHAPDPICKPTDKPSGTTIHLPLRDGRNSPTQEAFNSLAFAFTPAMQNGIRIVRSSDNKKVDLSPCKMPLRTEVVESEFEVDGKAVKIDIGILPEGIKLDRGPFWLIYGHRIIDQTSIGAGQYSVRRIAGTITIGDGWALAKNKDDLSENQDRLADEIFNRIEHILKKADQLAETVESSLLRGELQDAINDAISGANRIKEKRDKGESSGTAAPKGTGRTRSHAAKTQNGHGSVLTPGSNRRRGCYILDFYEDEEIVVGKFDRHGMRVSLNTKNNFIAQAKESGNREALVCSACSLIADHSCTFDEKENPLVLRYDDFTHAMGSLVNNYSKGKADAKSAV